MFITLFSSITLMWSYCYNDDILNVFIDTMHSWKKNGELVKKCFDVNCFFHALFTMCDAILSSRFCVTWLCLFLVIDTFQTFAFSWHWLMAYLYVSERYDEGGFNLCAPFALVHCKTHLWTCVCQRWVTAFHNLTHYMPGFIQSDVWLMGRVIW